MLPKENRLKKRKDFDQAFKKGKSFNESFLFLKIGKNSFKKSRFGFVVSQKISKKATERNKVKRRLREIVRKKLPSIKEGMDIILIAKPEIENKEHQEIKKLIDKLFEKAKILK